MTKKEKYTTYPTGPLSYSRMVQALREALGPWGPSLLAAKDINRLISSISPTGKVIVQDAFEVNAVHWLQFGSGGVIALSTAYAFQGNAAMRLTTQAVADQTCEAGRLIGFLRSGRIGFESWFSFSGVDPALISGVYWRICKFGDLNRESYNLVYIPLTGTWQIIVGNVYETIFKAEMNYEAGVWHHVKLCADLDVGRYISVEADDQIAYPTDKTFHPIPGTGGYDRTIGLGIGVTTANAVARFIDVDDVVITMEEP